MRAHTIHHVTAITADLPANIEFYTRVLGLRLVKKSVNQDDVRAYHLFYADRLGSPGTDLSFFDWPMAGSSAPGAGMVALTKFRVPSGSFVWWEARLTEANAHPQQASSPAGRPALSFSDPEGQRLVLVDDTGLAGEPSVWDQEVPAEFAIRGILGVDIESARPNDTIRVLTDLLGFHQTHASAAIFEAGDQTSYANVRLVQSASPRMGHVGAGGVHHVAFRVSDDEEIASMQKRIEAAGIRTSGLVDRFYFHSLYFREPGGVLFELATDGPGFSIDEPQEQLGERLSLPPFLEPRRTEIEAGLAAK